MPELPGSMVAGAPRLVFLHGFTQTHHHWHRPAFEIARRVGDDVSIVLADLPGHGLSGDDGEGIDRASTILPATCGHGTYVGYSMGGRFALAAACDGIAEIERLVLVGATPGITDARSRAERVRADEERALRLERDGVEPFVDAWTSMPMFAGLRIDVDDRSHRLRNSAQGLAHSLRTAGTGIQPDLWGRLAGVSVPVLVLAGERDAKFVAVGRRMSAELPDAQFATIEGAGHAAHLEQPERTADAIAAWISRVGQASPSPTANSTP